MEEVVMNLDFYKDKHVLITGHTGFKGSWLSKVLSDAGAIITGYSLEPPTSPNLFSLCKFSERYTSIIGDIRDLSKLREVFDKSKPDIVFHLAAQPIVRESYINPQFTYETNVMGTVNILECIRLSTYVKSFINVTTDKVYENKEWAWGYRENETLNGFDPYSNSKSCSELVTQSYKNSFFSDNRVAISTARAGNVIGGGDFAKDRIIPDCVRAALNNEKIIVRNPNSVRPYQHVLEPIFAYILLAQKQYEDGRYAGCYNVGPDETDCKTTGELVSIFCKQWNGEITWESTSPGGGPHEANFLKLDCSKIKKELNWKPQWNTEKAVEKVVEWSKCWVEQKDVNDCMSNQIREYLNM